MHPNNLIEWLGAAADTRYVNGPFQERGGIFIIGPPGSFKSTVIDSAMEDNPEILPCSNLNAKQWSKIRSSFIAQRLTGITIGEFELIYRRARATAEMTEGIIHQLVAEGNLGSPGSDPRMQRARARALFIGGITDDCYERRFDEWEKSGFARRFLWMLMHVNDPSTIVKAIREWKRIDFGAIMMKPANKVIPMDLTEDESVRLEKILRVQPGLHGTGYILMKKIFCVLKWKYRRNPEKAVEILMDVAPAFSKHGAELIL